MNPNQSQEIPHEPVDRAAVITAVENEFTFVYSLSDEEIKACKHLEQYGRGLAIEIATLVPEGKERTVAINAVLNAIVWARQGITRNRVEMVAVSTTNPA